MAWHAVAHGADAVLYWQWRSAPGGQEQLHGTLVDQSGQPRPFYKEAKQLASDFAATSDVLAGTIPVAEVALLDPAARLPLRHPLQPLRAARPFPVGG